MSVLPTIRKPCCRRLVRGMPRLVLLLLLLPAAVWSQTQADNDAIFSRTATSIWSSNDVSIPSPDGKKAIIVKQPEQPDGDETHTVLVQASFNPLIPSRSYQRADEKGVYHRCIGELHHPWCNR